MIGKLIFPSLCLHCKETVEGKRAYLCLSCRTLLTLLDPQQRCLYCFTLLDQGSLCKRCVEKPVLFKRVASAFDYQGPAATFIHLLKFSQSPYFAKDLAAWMVMQYMRLKWPLPDIIVPVPLSKTHFFKRGYNQSQLLALEMGKLLDRPLFDALKRSSEGFSQMGLDREQREKLSADAFSWKKYRPLENQTVLLIDDVMTTGTTLRHCGTLLQHAFPKAIYALTVCLA